MKMEWTSSSDTPSVQQTIATMLSTSAVSSGPRKTILVCLFTGGDPGDKPQHEYKTNFQQHRMLAIEAAWADADVVSGKSVRKPIEGVRGVFKHCVATSGSDV